MLAQVARVVHQIDLCAQRLARRQVDNDALADFAASSIVGNHNVSGQVEGCAPVDVGIARD